MKNTCEWKGVPRKISEWDSFIYCIVNNDTGQKYIGQKTFWSKKTLNPLKGKKRKRIVYKESDWKEYYGSSEWLKADVEMWGKENFSRYIITLCKTKWDKHYWEAKYQMDNDVLLSKDFYNGIIQVRLNNRPKNHGHRHTIYKKKLGLKLYPET